MIRVTLVGIRVPANQPIVLLREADGPRFLPIFIGQTEAMAIINALQGVEPPRPMTHDLFTTVLDALEGSLERVEITELQDGTFYAEIELRRGETTTRISSRPSDAIALAVRTSSEVELLVAEEVLEEAGVLLDTDGEDEPVEEEQVEQFREFLDQVRPEDFAQ